MERFAREGLLPNFKILHDDSEVYTTQAVEKHPYLEPWIQWITVHSGLNYDEHGVYRLGDGGDLDVQSRSVSSGRIRLHEPENLLGSRREGSMAKLNINGRVRDVQVEPDTPLLWVIREQVGLTGTKYGCGVAQCGACSVHINGELVRSCVLPVGGVKATDRIVTIEGLSATSSHPVQKAWAELDVPQCGYCQSGQIMAAAALLRKKPKPTDREIDDAMTNICRCGTYQRIRAAVHMAAGRKQA
jgi:isoquinoline 1-oxidoreductase alpha subunit